MTEFKPFENDSQAVTFPSGADELSLENGTDCIVLSGTMTFTKGDTESKADLQALLAQLGAVLKAMD